MHSSLLGVVLYTKESKAFSSTQALASCIGLCCSCYIPRIMLLVLELYMHVIIFSVSIVDPIDTYEKPAIYITGFLSAELYLRADIKALATL